MFTDERLALIREVLPRTLRSLFLLRITLCTAGAALALVKIVLSPPVSTFFIDILSDTSAGLESWMKVLNVVVSGLLAACISLVITTFLIQARLKIEASREDSPEVAE